MNEETLAARALVYRTLQSITADVPQRNNVAVALSDVFIDALGRCGVRVDEVGFANEARAFDADGDTYTNNLISQYTRLFCGPGKLAAPPWESSYMEAGRKIFQRNTLDVRASYRTQGLRAHAVNKIPDDALSIELGFMAELAMRMCGSDESAHEAYRASANFLETHLGRWAETYARDVEASHVGTFYPLLMTAMASFVQADEKLLAHDDLLATPIQA